MVKKIMSITVGVIMDPIESVNVKKDTTFAMMLEAQKRKWRILCVQQQDLIYRDNNIFAKSRELRLYDDETKWYEYSNESVSPLSECDVIFMRKDPPFNQEYINTTYMLDHLQRQGVVILNSPQALRDWNEKFSITFFPDICPATLVSRNSKALKDFCLEHKHVVYKRLDTMGGKQIFQATDDDKNLNVILETLTQDGKRSIMAQQYLDDIRDGDKRIIIVDGQVIPFGLARIPSEDDFRGNLARGAQAKGFALSEQDYKVAERVAPSLVKHDVIFAGIDVIGNYLSEINITSPTCIREIDRECGTDIAALILDAIDRRLQNN